MATDTQIDTVSDTETKTGFCQCTVTSTGPYSDTPLTLFGVPAFHWTLVLAFVSTAVAVILLQVVVVSHFKDRAVTPTTGVVPLDTSSPYAAFFQDVVLVLNVNYPEVALNVTQFWRRFYSRLFKHVVFICRTPLPQLGVEGALRKYPRALHGWNGTTWGYHYAALPRIMRRYPDAEGVLYTNDDVVINYWNFLGANKSELWMSNNKNTTYSFYNLFPNGTYRNLKRDWAGWPEYQQMSQKFLFSLPPQYQEQYFNSTQYYRYTGGERVYTRQVCDMFYVPRRHWEAFGGVLVPNAIKAELLSEIAIPMAFLAMESPWGWDPILDTMEYNWDFWDKKRGSHMEAYDPRDHWKPSLPAYHPWKLGSEEARKQFVRTMATVDPSIAQLFPSFF